ncbi:MAG: trypsin-like peptidase domain-containing protein [SAR324 cluster bacterium]|nr:trypsin-like peptidase domain-containing protein [SAR324 cluster bacterium]
MNYKFFPKISFLLLISFSFFEGLQAQNPPIEPSVILITNHQQLPQWTSPWKRGFTSSGNGTGFLIQNRWILTNAHVVSNSRLLLLKKTSSAEPFIARVVAIAHDSDLAILEADDPSFYQGMHPLELGKLPELQSHVRTYGYPIGGTTISRTEGVVSRVEFGTYVHSGVDSHLIIQTDSAINPGNSGGPVIQDGKVVGVAFQSNPNLNDVGYLIPVPLVRRFLKDMQDGVYDGVPEIGIQVSNLLNRHLRRFLKLPSDTSGVLIDRVLPQTPAEGKLHVGDVLVEIGGVPIDASGMVDYEGYQVPFHIMAEHQLVGDLLNFRIWRHQQFKEVELELSLPPFIKDFRLSYDTPPQYLIFGGLIFMPLNRNYLQSSPPSPALLYEHLYREAEKPGTRREQVLMIVGILPSPVNAGYTNLKNFVLNRVNGIPIRSLKHLKSVLAELKSSARFYRFESEWDPTLVVLDKEAVYREHERILERYGIAEGEQL